MRSRLSIFTGAATLAAIALITVVMLTPTRGIAQGGPQAYTMDTDHLSVIFKVKHMDFSYVYGRFNKVEGGFVINENDPANSSFNMTIMAASVDTNVRNQPLVQDAIGEIAIVGSAFGMARDRRAIGFFQHF